MFISWLVFVSFSSLYPFSGFDVEKIISIIPFDKVVHFVFYFFFCVWGVLFIREITKGRISLVKALVITFLVTVFYGAIIEVLQHLVTVDRNADFFDGLANSLGSFCGALVMKFLFSNRRQLKWEY